MGNLVGGWRRKEPSTVEECDSTWGSDSESEGEDSGVSESASPGGDSEVRTVVSAAGQTLSAALCCFVVGGLCCPCGGSAEA